MFDQVWKLEVSLRIEDCENSTKIYFFIVALFSLTNRVINQIDGENVLSIDSIFIKLNMGENYEQYFKFTFLEQYLGIFTNVLQVQ